MEKQIRLLTLVLIACLALGVINAYQLARYTKHFETLNSNLQHTLIGLQNNLNSSIWSMDRRLASIQEGSNWVTATSFSPDTLNSSPSEIYLDLTWSFNELERDADVYVLYQQRDTDEWIRVDPISLEGLSYSATLMLSPHYEYQYKVVAEGSVFKSDAPATVPTVYYQPSPLSISSWGGSKNTNDQWIGEFHLEFEQRGGLLFDFFRVQSVTTILHTDNGDSRRISVPGEDRGHDRGSAWTVVFNVDGIVKAELEIEYGDGTVHRAKIWPNPEEYESMQVIERVR